MQINLKWADIILLWAGGEKPWAVTLSDLCFKEVTETRTDGRTEIKYSKCLLQLSSEME